MRKKFAYFEKLRYRASFHNPKLSDTSVADTSQIHASAMLLLTTDGN
jgi:hypothetical protein